MRLAKLRQTLAYFASFTCLCITSGALAQSPYLNQGYGANPYGYAYGTNAYQRSERYAATKPVSYTFPVHRDYATAFALQTDPRWGNTPQRVGLQPVTTYRPVTQLNRPNSSGQFVGHPGYSNRGCQRGVSVAGAVPRAVAPYYPGDSLFGSRKLYTDGEPVRNFFRYLTP